MAGMGDPGDEGLTKLGRAHLAGLVGFAVALQPLACQPYIVATQPAMGGEEAKAQKGDARRRWIDHRRQLRQRRRPAK